ncbi:hypothetical protein ABR737_40900 [Streptomyces sp. Edi2]|uniref:hypothetical protein n=1 Tax=Streptomyces sp. Edi2 TaxID=3162528 RepID=UPI003305F23B
MRAFPVVLPSGQRYWTVLDDDLEVVPVVDRWLRNLRFGRDRAELTTKSYAGSVALYLRWCRSTNRQWASAGRDLGLFIVWLKYTPAPRDGVAPVVQPGPGAEPVRGERRVNRVLVAVRGLLSYAVSVREAPWAVLGQIYELADSRDLPAEAQGEDGGLFYRPRPVRACGAATFICCRTPAGWAAAIPVPTCMCGAGRTPTVRGRSRAMPGWRRWTSSWSARSTSTTRSATACSGAAGATSFW